jgi:hypothetical protein
LKSEEFIDKSDRNDEIFYSIVEPAESEISRRVSIKMEEEEKS